MLSVLLVWLRCITLAISEAEELTQPKSKTADRGLRLHRLVLALRRARAQLRGARARNRRERTLADPGIFRPG
jgi:hypothetical protein